MICLPKEISARFLSAIEKGELNPGALAEMSSEARRDELAKVLGEGNAKGANALLESKLLLKNQQAGIERWIKTIGGLGPDGSRDLLKQFNNMKAILSPEDERKFLADLAAKKLGSEVTVKETKSVAAAANEAQMARNALALDPMNPKLQEEYGAAYLKFLDHVDSLKPSKLGNVIVGAANVGRTLSTVGDWGWTFRQGWGMMSRPQLWEGLVRSFKYAAKDASYQKLRAQVIGDPDYELMKTGGLRLPAVARELSGKEEEFMNQFTGKVPLLKQIERGQQGLATFVRFSVAKKMLRDARLAGEDIRKGSQPVRDIMNSVNNFSGSGNLGVNDRYANVSPVLNAGLFSARKISATVNMANPLNYFSPKISMTARKANLRNLIGSLGMTASAIYLAKLAGSDINTEPTSSDFLKARIGNHHIDLSGGNLTYATLMARMIKNQSTSTTGKVTKFGEGYKPETRGSTLFNFVRNKLSPMAGVLADSLLGPIPSHDSQLAKELFGPLVKKPDFDLKRELTSATVPMMIDLLIQGVRDDPGNLLVGGLADFFGNSDSIY